MSILIKGLKLPPVGIRQCIVSFADDYLLITDVCGKILFESEYVKIPTPHGRLIDADKLFDPMETALYAGWSCDPTDIANKIILEAPTIIEAEVKNE